MIFLESAGGILCSSPWITEAEKRKYKISIIDNNFLIFVSYQAQGRGLLSCNYMSKEIPSKELRLFIFLALSKVFE